MAYRVKLLPHKRAKQEHELHIITSPHRDSFYTDDYQAPLTSSTLPSKSKWLIVRNNIHKIRSWGGINTSHIEPQYRDWYLFFQMRRELRHAQKHIQQIEQRSDVVPVRYFDLPLDETHIRRYNVSHLRSTDALYHPGFGSEPVVLQSLFYYFSNECVVPYNSIFRTFLSNVCSILYHKRQPLKRAAVFRRVALVITVIVSIILAMMLFSLILSVFKTTSNLKYMYENDPDGGIEWRESQTNLSFL